MEYMKELPEVFSLTEEYRGLGDGLSPEMKAIREAVGAIPAEYLPGSAGELLPRWEKILGLKGAGNLSERRFSVLSRLAGLRPYTIARLRQQLSAAMGEGKFTAEVDPENFLLRVEVEAGSEHLLSAMSRELRRMIPSNIELETAAGGREETGVFQGAVMAVTDRLRISVHENE